MLENPRLSTIKLKNISKQEVSYLPSHFGLEGIITFKKKKKICFDLGLDFDSYENESYSNFVAKAWFPANFLQTYDKVYDKVW